MLTKSPMETIKNLIAFLAKSSYPYPLSQKLLIAPSARDFQSIFKFTLTLYIVDCQGLVQLGGLVRGFHG